MILIVTNKGLSFIAMERLNMVNLRQSNAGGMGSGDCENLILLS